MDNAEIRQAGLELLCAEDAAAALEVPAKGASDQLAVLVERRDSLAQRRADIGRRRMVGEEHPDDLATVALIALDIEGLDSLIAEARTTASSAQAKLEAGNAAVRVARTKLQSAQHKARVDALVRHANELDGLLVATIGEIDALGVGRRAPHRPIWGASKELRTLVNELAIRRGDA